MSAPVAQPPDLLPRIAAGDSAAVRECIARYGGLVWSLSRRLSLSSAEAEDAVQEVFIELWRTAGRFDPSIASETAFVAMIARRRLIDRRRRLSRQPDRQELTEFIADANADSWRGAASSAAASARSASSPNDPAGAASSEEAANAIRALDDLSIEQQRVLRLSIYRGLSHDAIAHSLAIPLGTVKTHARRGLIRLRELLGLNHPIPESSSTSSAGGQP